ncbi:hypothetical protein pb186bvf_007967 [Paramecium bursaria]
MFQNKYCQVHPPNLNIYLNLNSLTNYKIEKWICQLCYNTSFIKNSLTYQEIVQRFISGKDQLTKNHLNILESLYQEFEESFQGQQKELHYYEIGNILNKILQNPFEDSDYENLYEIESFIADESQIYLLSDDQIISLIHIEEFIFSNDGLKQILKLLKENYEVRFKNLMTRISIVVSQPILQKYEYDTNQNIIEVLPCNNNLLVEQYKHQLGWNCFDLKIVDLDGQTVKQINPRVSSFPDSVFKLNQLLISIRCEEPRKILVFASENNQKHIFSLNFKMLSHIKKDQIIQTNKSSQFLISINKQLYHCDTKGKKIISRILNLGQKFIYDQKGKIILMYSNNKLILQRIQNKKVITCIESNLNLSNWVLLSNHKICVQFQDIIYSVYYNKTIICQQQLAFERQLQKNTNIMATSEDLHYLIVFRMDNIINIFDHNLLLLKSVFIRVLEPIDSIRVSQDMDSLILKSPLFKLNLIPSVLKLNLIDDL